ncbi:hypothetical protein [Streptacidiphilus rugosus]|uniref:hypothetical protein n=1 Tax=Streptacidiphilus rugosus TaxID=405783 RepID=UPI000560547F|nr:hypothetical protein [Streptacidiphilus rugosus]
MNNADSALGRDALYLDATARGLGWRVYWEPDGTVLMSKGPWTLLAVFDHDGAFRFARAHGPNTGGNELTLPQLVDALEHWPTP